MKRNFIFFFVILSSLASCKKGESVDDERIVGLWKRFEVIEITNANYAPDTLTQRIEDNSLFHMYTEEGDYVEYSYNKESKNYFMESTYRTNNSVIYLFLSEDEYVEIPFKLKDNELLLTIKDNGNYIKKYRLIKAI